MSSKARLGWSAFFESQVAAIGAESGDVSRPRHSRVVEEQRGVYRLDGDYGGWAEVSGRFRHEAAGPGEFPAVGDWVVVHGESSSVMIHRVLERRSALSRAAAGRASQEQVIAANVDTVLIVTAAIDDLNPRRLERYLTMVWDSGASPVIVVNKIDAVSEGDRVAENLRRRLPLAEIVTTSALGEGSIAPLEPYLASRTTIALVGSSGVGKSTLVNRLIGRNVQATAAVRDSDGRGRHTTTARQLIELPGGALLIDTPGMRELTPWSDAASVDGAFEDIARLASGCRFADCAHDTEPECAVRMAIAGGSLSEERLASYRRLAREAEFEAGKKDLALAAEKKRRWKKVARAQRSLYKERDR